MKLEYDQPMPAPVRVNRPGPAPTFQSRLWERVSVELPANLRLWFCDSTVICWIRQELEKQGGAQRQPGRAQRQSADDDATNLLSVLAFGYASLVFASDEIANACRCDPAFWQLCHGHAPFAHELRSFRRHNRRFIESLLTVIFARAITHKFGLMSALLPAELQEDLRRHASERLDLARHMDTNPAL